MRIHQARFAAALAWRTDALIERLPTRYRVWVENQRDAFRVRSGRTSFDRGRLTRTYRESIRRLLRSEPAEALGDYLEFGVYHGTTLSSIYEARRQLGLDRMRLFGFDSFQGLPQSAATEDDGLWTPGQFRSSLERTRENLSRWGVPPEDVTLVEGWFSETCTPETRTQYAIERASVIMIDCDLYSSTVEALAFCEPLIGTQAVIVFDDWGAGGLDDRRLGERRAFEEFLARHLDLRAEELHGLQYKDKGDPKIVYVTRVAPA